MKYVLASVAALGLSVSAASACNYHSMASAQVDTQQTASVEKSDMTKATDTKIIKKQAPPAKAD